MSNQLDFRHYIREVEDFPKPGIRFYDIAPLLGSGAVFAAVIAELVNPLQGNVDKIIGFDARGFLFGGAMAASLGVGCALLRKPGKLPGAVSTVSYDLEYGTNSLELQTDMVTAGERVVLIDDIIATGGTALAGIELVRGCGADIVEFCSVIDLPLLGGSAKIREQQVPIRSIITIEEV
jgi:adenine phosphoribosyltransferase